MITILKEKASRIAEKVVDLLLEDAENSIYEGIDRNELYRGIKAKVDALIKCLEARNNYPFEQYIQEVGLDEAFQGCSFQEILTLMTMIQTAFLEEIEEVTDDLLKVLKRTKIIVYLIDQAKMALSNVFLYTREEIIEQQKMSILELSTPVLPITEEILIVPIIGTVDTNRARDIMENLLQGIVDKKAQAAILDVTGVPVIDTAVADHIIKTVQAAKLLGCNCMLVGISPEVAQALVSLGIDFSNIITKQSLQQGLEYALEILKLQITPINS